MATTAFKSGVTERFILLAETLMRSGTARNYTAIAGLLEQPLQVVSKLMTGKRIVTLEQAGALSKNANVNADWLLTGVGEMFKETEIVSESSDDVLLEISRAVSRFELQNPLAEKLILAFTEMKKENNALKDEVSSLKEKIIKMLEAIAENT